MAKSRLGGADNRPRIYIRPAMDATRAGWRIGHGGIERAAANAGLALVDALVSIDYRPAVIFWEGRTDG